MVSERKIKDFLKCKFRYTDIEQELLLMHMKNNKIIEICQVNIKDETTEVECEHRAVFSIKNVDSNEQKNLKLLELEINLYTLSDAIEEIDSLKDEIQENIKEYVRLGIESSVADMLKFMVYAEEVWVNLARSITMIEEQLHSFQEISEVTIKLLIRQSRRDVYFFEKWRKYLKHVIEVPGDEQEDSRSNQAKEKMAIPQWIRKVIINKQEIQNEVNMFMAEKSVDEYDEFLSSFVKKVQIDIKTRETFNLARRSVIPSEHMQSLPSSYMGTITKFQEFFGLNAEGEPLEECENPFEKEVFYDENRFMDETHEDSSPEVRKSVMVVFEPRDT